MHAPVTRKISAARAEKGWGRKGVSVVGLYEKKGREVGGHWARTPERARALACSTVCLARRGRVVLIWRRWVGGIWEEGRREVGRWACRHWVVLDEAWRVDDRDECFKGAKARGQRKDIVEYGIGAIFV